jgi:hypothetical protein
MMAAGSALAVGPMLYDATTAESPFYIGDVAFDWKVPYVAAVVAGLLLWAGGSVWWLLAGRKAGPTERRLRWTTKLAIILPWSLLIGLRSVPYVAVLAWLTDSFAPVGAESVEGCRAFLSNGGDRGSLYYAPASAGRLIEARTGWSSKERYGPSFDPVEAGTWSLRWDGETAVLDVWGSGGVDVSVHGQAVPCPAPS